MRFLFLLLFALSVTLAWHTAALATVTTGQQCISAQEAPEDGKKKPDEDEEPDCD